MSVELNAIGMGARMGLIVDDFDEQTAGVDRVDGGNVSERTNGGIFIFFLVLFISAGISTFGLWELARFLIREFS